MNLGGSAKDRSAPAILHEFVSPIWRQTKGRVTDIAAGLRTTGTGMGAGQFLAELSSKTENVAADTATWSHEIAGLKHPPPGPIPADHDASMLDRHEQIWPEAAFDANRRLA